VSKPTVAEYTYPGISSIPNRVSVTLEHRLYGVHAEPGNFRRTA
jgi:hypothetical protein